MGKEERVIMGVIVEQIDSAFRQIEESVERLEQISRGDSDQEAGPYLGSDAEHKLVELSRRMSNLVFEISMTRMKHSDPEND